MKYWIYGIHTVRHALQNPQRHFHRLCLLPELAQKWQQDLQQWKISPKIISVSTKDQINALVPQGAVHQGVALLTDALPTSTLDEIIWPESTMVIVLDGVTDPHNIGAILRSAAAFGASALITPHHHTPVNAFGTVFKTASGGGEYVPWLMVPNLARAMDTLKELGFWCYGFAEDAPEVLGQYKFSGRVALVLGAEGDGLRMLTSKKCDIMLRLPTVASFSTLNVSNAAAIALYDVHNQIYKGTI